MTSKPRVSVVGATGLVGREILRLLDERKFPLSKLSLFASQRSDGQEVIWKGKEYAVQALTKEALLEQTDVALCSAGRTVSRELRPWVQGTSTVVIDNSSAFRMDPSVPLVVPEVNPGDLKGHNNYIANPNCSTIQLVVALKPLADAFGLKRVIVTTYQSVSGAGHKGMEELSSQIRDLFNGKPSQVNHFPRRIAFNCIPQIGPFDDVGYTEEEMKVTDETRKILGIPQLPVSCTAVRVPVYACHSEAVTVDLERPATAEAIRALLSESPGIAVSFKPGQDGYPTPAECVETPEVHVGRIRPDLSGNNAFHLWVVSDNLWKGAALNAVQIAEQMLKDGLL